MLGYLTMNDDDSQLQELASGFREALRHSVYLVRRLDADGELSASQLSTLKMMLGEGQRVGEIARNLGVRVPSATEQIIKLERAGLARREPDPADSRAVRVILTDEGRAAVDSANRRRNQVMAGILGTLTDQDRKALAAALPVIDKINASLQN
ncbi:DNA-binding MarR family transcriptional regulator [Arthrobacter sp. SLBN-122]|nr:DNA-binding MarR family transcriptional regulator [Arthrobacter sp. SLBN-122]